MKKRPRDKAWGLKSSQSGKRCRVRSCPAGRREIRKQSRLLLVTHCNLKLRRQDGHCLHTPLVTGRPGRQFSAWCRAGWCTCASRPTLCPGCGSRSSSSMASHEVSRGGANVATVGSLWRRESRCRLTPSGSGRQLALLTHNERFAQRLITGGALFLLARRAEFLQIAFSPILDRQDLDAGLQR